jgi:hypothetical protein
MKYTGSCHCGKIAFEAEGEIGQVLDCNCSMCRRRGSLLWFVPRAQFKLMTPESDLGIYEFNKHVIHHYFCASCGIAPFSEGRDPKGNQMAAVNVRCLDDVDLASLKVMKFEGASMP